jgi:hypothetical protein
MISGSRNRFSRNGSTAASESGPPSWNKTIPTRFFPAKLLPSAHGAFQPLDVRPQSGKALPDAEIVAEENRPPEKVSRKNAVKVFH